MAAFLNLVENASKKQAGENGVKTLAEIGDMGYTLKVNNIIKGFKNNDLYICGNSGKSGRFCSIKCEEHYKLFRR
jgi:hypothetical protein